MIVTKLQIDGLFIIEPKFHSDNRGWFCETYNEKNYLENGIK